MRISDWSSDVCSSDLKSRLPVNRSVAAAHDRRRARHGFLSELELDTMNAPTGRLADSLTLPQPYLLFLGDTTEAGYAKTAFGLADWAADRCVGEYGIGEIGRAHG